MGLKVGDRIKYIGPSPRHYVGLTGVINEVRGNGRDYPYRIRFDNNGSWYPVLASEVEKFVAKGQQLLFSFMEGV